MIEKTKKQKKGSVSEEDISSLLQRYTATTVLALLQEVAQFPGVKLNWNALVKKTSTGISNAREYQMLWRHLAYRDVLLEKLEDGAEPLDDESDLEYELEPCPSVSSEASAEAAACVKVLIASGLPSDSSLPNSSTVEAPLTINIPNGQSFRASSENSQPTCSMRGMNITVPVSVQKQILPAVTSAETSLEGNGLSGANLPARRKRKPWSEAEDRELIAAVQKCGVGNWANILRGDFKGDRSASQLAQRWTIIKKRLGNLNVEGNSTIPQLSEAQLATRSALSLALDMPDKNLTSACPSNPALKTTSSNSALPSTSGEASVPAQSQFQQAHNQPQKGPITSVPAQNLSQQGPVASLQVSNQSQQGPMITKTSPGSSGSTLKSRVGLKKPPAKSFSSTGSILDATAVAAGARIGGPKAAASLLKAAQSKNAIHIMTSSGSSAKPLMPSVKSPIQRVEHTPSASSSSLNVSIQQCNTVTSSPTVDGTLKEELDAAGENKSFMSDGLPKELVKENGACVSKNEQGEGVREDKPAVSNLESESKNLEVVAAHSNEKSMVEGNQLDAITNPVEESQNAIDCSLIKKSDSQPEASINDGCTKNLEVLSTDPAT
ncbi:Homeodomain-like superfamily protein isoform 2 [Theobroma cacao]|uniref:Homeodomain-like superfamily protein isoform 2 n=1 Tax=Theobroma cacao TaxID=3641 RepID=A0A061FEW7_THECC|nr:Homeodomain-like superfamily protein isoform 2 [Theobroma cacao]